MKYFIVTYILVMGILQATQAIAQDSIQEGIQYFQQGEYDEAVSVFEEIIERDAPERLEAYFFLARTYSITGNFQRGHAIVEEALEKYPDHSALKFARAELIGHADPNAGAELMHQLYLDEKDYSNLLHSTGIAPEELKSYAGQMYARAGSEFYGHDNLARSVEALENARELIPDSVYVHNNLIYTLLNKERFNEAVDAAEKALERFPENRNIRLMHSQALSLAGRGDDHLNEIEQLYRQDPDDPQAAMLYGQALLNEGNVIEAAQHFEEYLERNPQQRQIYRLLIRINQRQFEYEGLAEVLRKKAEAFPDEPNIRVELAEVLAVIEAYEEAREQYAGLYEITGDPYYVLEKARLFLAEEEWDKAIDEYIDIRDTFAESDVRRKAVQELIRLYEYQDETDLALQTAENAYRQYEDSQEMAILYLRQLRAADRYEEAANLAERIIGLPQVRSGIPYLVKAEMAIDEERKLNYVENVMREELEQTGRISEEIRIGARATLEGKLGEVDVQLPVLGKRAQLERHQRILDEAADIVNNVEDPESQVRFYRSLHDDYDSNIWVKQQKAEALTRNGKTEQAEEILTSAARINPDDTEIHWKTADLLEQNGEIENAIIAWERVLGTDEELEDAYRNLIRLHRSQGTLDELCNRWQSRYRSNPGNDILREYLIEALHRAGRMEEAREIVQDG